MMVENTKNVADHRSSRTRCVLTTPHVHIAAHASGAIAGIRTFGFGWWAPPSTSGATAVIGKKEQKN